MTGRRPAISLLGFLLSALAMTLVLSPSAGAATIMRVHGPSGQSTGGQVTLASTGLDIAAPIVVGLITLVVGIALVAWAFLRAPRSRHH